MRIITAYIIGDAIGFRRNLELLFSILIIGILAACAIQIYSQYRLKAIVNQVTGYTSHLQASHVYHAVTGEWPESTDKLKEFYHSEWVLSEEINDDYIKSISVAQGAVNFKFKNKEFEGNVMTLRPAVPSGDLIGPVIWICGENDRGGSWAIAGENYTDIETSLISVFLQ